MIRLPALWFSSGPHLLLILAFLRIERDNCICCESITTPSLPLPLPRGKSALSSPLILKWWIIGMRRWSKHSCWRNVMECLREKSYKRLPAQRESSNLFRDQVNIYLLSGRVKTGGFAGFWYQSWKWTEFGQN